MSGTALPLNSAWKSRLIALPGVLTLLSVLAVMLGSQPPVQDPAPRMTAGTVAPNLPELRAAPQPAPAAPVLTGTPPEPFRVLAGYFRNPLGVRSWAAPAWRPDLAVLGRQQTDGG